MRKPQPTDTPAQEGAGRAQQGWEASEQVVGSTQYGAENTCGQQRHGISIAICSYAPAPLGRLSWRKTTKKNPLMHTTDRATKAQKTLSRRPVANLPGGPMISKLEAMWIA